MPAKPGAWLTTVARRRALTTRAFDLARMLRRLLLAERETAGLMALLLVHEARRRTRTDTAGQLVRLATQDRSAWDRELIAEAHGLLVGALSAGPPGRFLLQAAIASLHAQAPSYDETDWPQILTLYDELLRIWPSPVVALNRAVALSIFAGGADAEFPERDVLDVLPMLVNDMVSLELEIADAAEAARLVVGDAEAPFAIRSVDCVVVPHAEVELRLARVRCRRAAVVLVAPWWP